ncbi:MAG: DUF5671 domain-containing protein [Patescibacteria group bacterium]
MLSFLIPFSFIALIIFGISGIIEGKSTMKKSSVIRGLYFYLASLITLAIVAGSLIYLGNLGLKSWVFTHADIGPSTRLGSPPSLALDVTLAPTATPTDKVIGGGMGELTCSGDCALTDSQRTTISAWETNYQAWIDSSANPGSQRARDAVAALSFLIVALPIFIIHFRIVQRDARVVEEQEHTVIRPTYFYFISLASLVMVVISAGFLINLALKTWVFPSAGRADVAAEKVYAGPQPQTVEGASVRSIVSCGAKCGLSAETVALAEQWPTDYDAWMKATSTMTSSTQRQAATGIPFVLVGVPLFWYHWAIVRREAKDKKVPVTPPTV